MTGNSIFIGGFGGTGTWTVGGTNTYTSTTIDSGTLRIGNGGTTGTLGSGSVTNNASLTFNRSNDLTVSNVISGSGSLTKLVAGTLTLTGNNTYSGTTTISAGTLQIGAGGTTGTLGSGNVTNNASLQFNRSNALTVSNAISGSGLLTKLGAETLTLSGTNTYTGLTTISAGTVRLGGTAALGSTAGGTTVASGATLDLNGVTLSAAELLTLNGDGVGGNGALINSSATAATYSGLITLGSDSRITSDDGDIVLSNTGIITGSGHALRLAGTTTGSWLGSVIGTESGTLIKSGTGTWELRAANTYTGATTIEGGRLHLGTNGTIATSSIVANGGNFTIGGNKIIKSMTGSGTTALGSHTLTMGDASNISGTYSGVISGTGSVEKAGTGTLTLGGVNTYTGATTISAGTLALNSTGTIAASSGVANSGNFSIAGNKTIDSMTGSGTTALGSHTLTIGDASNTPALYSGLISGTGSIVKAGTGALTLSGNNTYTGATTISAGSLVISNNNPAAATSTSAYNGSGTLTIEPTGTSFSGALSLASIPISGSLSGLTIGKAGNTANITMGASLIAGPITLYGGDITLNGALTATGTNTITLQGSGSITDGASGYVSADKLALTGSGNVTLDSASNAIGTLAASGVGSLTYVDSNALTIGTVNPSGISATGPVSITTLTGDLTVSQNISTTDTSSSAVVLNAGKNTAAGTAMGGNIIISGSPTITVGAGGTAKLFTGNVSGSTGLTTLVGSSSGRFRYNSDEAATNYTTALGTGLYAIYREQPTASVTVGNQTLTYGAPLTFSGSTTGTVNGDTPSYSVSNPLYSTSNNIRVGNYTLNASGLSELGYHVSSVSNGTLAVNPLALIGSIGAGTSIYGDALNPGTASLSNAVSGDDLGVATTAVTKHWFNTSSTGHLKAGNYTGIQGITALSGTDAGNYSFANVKGNYTVSTKALTVSASNASKTYGDVKTFTGTEFSSSGLVTGESIGSVTVTSSGAAATANVSGSPYTITPSSATGGSFSASNYGITYNTGSLTVNQRPISVTAANQSRTYGSANPTTGSVSLSSGTLANSDALGTATLTAGSATATANAGTTHALTPSSQIFTSGTVGNYAITYVDGSLSITARPISLTGSRQYDGTTALANSMFTLSNLANSEPLTLSGSGSMADKHVGAGKTVSLGDLALGNGTGTASNYTLTGGTHTTSITAAPITLTTSNVTKTYDGKTSAAGTATVSSGTLYGSDAISGGSFAFSNATAGVDNKTVTVSGVTLNDNNGGNNYTVSYANNTTSTINKKALTVVANSDSKFVTQADASGYNGVNYYGFANSDESSADLGGTLVISRSNSGTNTAGTYSGVLVASGRTSDNYSFNYIAGDYTITPADQLLVRVTNVSNTYGTATNYSIASAKYWDPTANAGAGGEVALAAPTANGGNNFTVSDGAGGTATFTLAPQGATTSGAGFVKAGSYQLATSGTVTENSGNFSDAITVVGAHLINAKDLTPSVTGVSKTYDGTAAMTGVAIGLTGKETNDAVTVSGAGSFSQANAGSSLGYTLSNLALAGADAGNYLLTGGSSFSGSDGVIGKANATVTANSSTVTYNGQAKSVTGFTASGLVNGETIAVLDGVSTTGGSGTNAGSYTHTVGGTDENYNLSFTAGRLSIVEVAPTPTPTPTPTPDLPVVIPAVINLPPLPPFSFNTGASATGGDSGDAVGAGKVGAGGISISLNAAPLGDANGAVQNSVVTVSVPKAMATSGAGFSFDLPAQVRESLGTGAIQATLADGSPLPDWIRFNPATQRFEASAVPDGGLPLQIMLRTGEKQVLIAISERAE